MHVLTATNTYLPHIGGVARSVSSLVDDLRTRGHRVTVLAPVFDDVPADEAGVIRVPAIQRYNGSDFSVPVPIGGNVQSKLDATRIDLVHSHHPFLLGDTALRVGSSRAAPVVFTHHTMYEQYTHYVPGDSPALGRFAIQLVTGYCNLCDAVIAPSRTVASILAARGVRVPVEVVPTGVDFGVFHPGDGAAFRRRAGIPEGSWVVGHAGRLAPEKNLAFLVEAILGFLAEEPSAHALVAGDGVLRGWLLDTFDRRGMANRLHLTGSLQWADLRQAYQAMDAFAFASHSETQGMVVTEALASGVPVVAVDAAGVREVVENGVNGVLLPDDDLGRFVAALRGLAENELRRRSMGAEARRTAARVSRDETANRTIRLYEDCIRRGAAARRVGKDPWSTARRRFAEELKIIGNIVSAAADAVAHRPAHERHVALR